MSAELKRWPERIWLQHDETDCTGMQQSCIDEATWCAEQIGPADIEYVRADRIAELEDALAKAQAQAAIPEQLFDSYAVVQALSERAKQRTSPLNVADVLSATVKLIKAAAPTPDSEQP